MRIIEQEQASRVRVAELRLALSLAISNTPREMTVAEILQALLDTQAYWTAILLQEELKGTNDL